jgi:hypothetical protein
VLLAIAEVYGSKGDKMKPILALFLLAIVGCAAGPTHWKRVPDPLYDEQDHLVCNSTGMTVAGVQLERDGTWEVWGGNGALYGNYETKEQATNKASSLVSGGETLHIGGKFLTCKK